MNSLKERVTYQASYVPDYIELFKAAEPTMVEFLAQWRDLGNRPQREEDIQFYITEFKFFYNHSNIFGAFAQLPGVNYCACSKTMVVGLGDIDLMNYNVCSHGVSATLKYMLPTLTVNDNAFVVYDSVAGGCDLLG